MLSWNSLRKWVLYTGKKYNYKLTERMKKNLKVCALCCTLTLTHTVHY